MRNVLEYLERTAARVPDKTAFADEAHALTFSQLLAGSRAVGTLVARRAEKSRPVGVLVGRDAYTPLGFFAALQAGCCYVPLDPQMPSARLDAILRQLDPAVVLYTQESAKIAAQLGCPTFSIEDNLAADIDGALLKTRREATPAQILAHLRTLVPKYMFPNVFCARERLPHNQNGKIDRAALKKDCLNG